MTKRVFDNLDPLIQTNVSTSELTTLGVGGKCDSYAEVVSLDEFVRVCEGTQDSGVPILVIGEGSNLLFSDSGFAGRVIRNRICWRSDSGEEVEVGGGENLSSVIRWLNKLGLAGMQKMYGIPGTVAGALVGNAGAYGQEIGDVVTEVDAWKDGVLKTFPKEALELGYRSSLFKSSPGWFIVRCRLRLQKSDKNLQAESDAILTQRLIKYPVGLKCPGSFFKNVLLSEVSQEARDILPDEFVIGRKIPAGKLLEAVGARGASRGDAQFADYHGNLIINKGRATSEEILFLASQYALRVMEHFRIRLEPEILIVDDRSWSCLGPVRNRT